MGKIAPDSARAVLPFSIRRKLKIEKLLRCNLKANRGAIFARSPFTVGKGGTDLN